MESDKKTCGHHPDLICGCSLRASIQTPPDDAATGPLAPGELDLAAIEARVAADAVTTDDVLDLIAEVRRGREAAETLARALSGLNAALAAAEEEIEQLQRERDKATAGARRGW